MDICRYILVHTISTYNYVVAKVISFVIQTVSIPIEAAIPSRYCSDAYQGLHQEIQHNNAFIIITIIGEHAINMTGNEVVLYN